MDAPVRSTLMIPSKSGTYNVYGLETEESAEEHHKLPSFKDVSRTPWTSKEEVKSRTSLKDLETV
jgi:hypothetical protein